VGYSSESLTPTTDVLRASIYATSAARVGGLEDGELGGGEEGFCGGLKMREVGLVEAILARVQNHLASARSCNSSLSVS
jgi:hypothetical protein